MKGILVHPRVEVVGHLCNGNYRKQNLQENYHEVIQRVLHELKTKIVMKIGDQDLIRNHTLANIS